ncbi:hypothetical protein FQN60_003031 [Etheostoma spectabile]|uniref:Uncharacterized protein n=1 Tax=Etheostoma spectabile TaxID=54343 RepID=A0A5J5CMA2_9PERO|nr:hypothetical protein FQN60_003031 [Etheostoma spectabile]
MEDLHGTRFYTLPRKDHRKTKANDNNKSIKLSSSEHISSFCQPTRGLKCTYCWPPKQQAALGLASPLVAREDLINDWSKLLCHQAPSCSKPSMMNLPNCLMNLYFRAMRPPVFCNGVYSEVAKGGRRGDPFVPR